jgi:hypothetical protein
MKKYLIIGSLLLTLVVGVVLGDATKAPVVFAGSVTIESGSGHNYIYITKDGSLQSLLDFTDNGDWSFCDPDGHPLVTFNHLGGIQLMDGIECNGLTIIGGGTFINSEGQVIALGAAFSGDVGVGTLTFGGATIQNALTATATLDFSSTSAQTSSDLTISVTGAADGDCVMLGTPNASILANTSYSAWVSAADTVTVRFLNASSTSKDPASGTFRVTIIKF